MNCLIIQARMGSSRLPGKVLKMIGGKYLLEQLVSRIQHTKSIDKIVVATSTNKEDDAIEEFCKKNNILISRGSDWDVLDRFYKAALQYGCTDGDTVIRITADCPLHHEDVVQFSINEFDTHSLDYFSNSFAPLYEDGCDTEVFRFSALKKAHEEAKLLSQREHVTPFIKDSGIFLCGYKKYDPAYHYKLSVDTIEDHTAVENIFSAFSPRTDFTIHEVVELLGKKPELIAANKESVINAGYAKSLQNDKEIK
ncbi:MAG TPA: glycosyltransferase family protein [Bacteroidia bacterium]|nr:glycosyltransferase family protein [Bacteroidia bacterium]